MAVLIPTCSVCCGDREDKKMPKLMDAQASSYGEVFLLAVAKAVSRRVTKEHHELRHWIKV